MIKHGRRAHVLFGHYPTRLVGQRLQLETIKDCI